MTHQIIPIAEEHVASLHAVFDVVAREKRFLTFLEAAPLEQFRAFVVTNIKENNPQFVAVSAGDVVGCCDVIPKRSKTVHAHIGTIGVWLSPHFRGKGIGRQLMQRTLAAAFASGLTRIELTVRENNANAIALYKSLGFEIEGLHKNAIRIEGQYENIYSMALLKT